MLSFAYATCSVVCCTSYGCNYINGMGNVHPYKLSVDYFYILFFNILVIGCTGQKGDITA